MRQLACEICGSTDVIKQGNYFVCQECGCKYSMQETKNLVMGDDPNNVMGTVKVDNSDLIEKYLQNARRAKEKEDWEETEKYYNMVEQNDPSNIEAIFYSSYGKAKQSLTDADLYKRQAVFNVLNNCVSMLDDNYDVNKDYDEQLAIVKQISSDLLKLFASNYVYNSKSNGYGLETSNDKAETVKLFRNIYTTFCETVCNIAVKYQNDVKSIEYYKIALNISEYALKNLNVLRHEIINNMINYHNEIKKLDSTHNVPTKDEIEEANPKAGGCYVATCVYGSYNCPQVWTLRRFRDNTLGSTWYGRLFIRVYYAVSPTLVKWFGNTNWFKKLWRGKLDRMVRNLQSKGVEDTPYEDKQW